MQAFLKLFEKKLKAKKLKQIIQKLNNLPTNKYFFLKKVLTLLDFAQTLAKT